MQGDLLHNSILLFLHMFKIVDNTEGFKKIYPIYDKISRI